MVRRIFEPFINFFRFVPAIGFLTLFLMWFGVGEESKVAIIIYATMFPVIINTIAGVSGISPITIQVAQSQGASAGQIFFTVTIPASVPYIFTGVRLGLSGAIISIVAAEMLAAQKGIGYLIYTSRLYFRTDWIFVGIITLGLTGYFSDRFLRYFGRTVLKRYGVTDRK
jgi:NitT/TauT family transport system permease protein